MSITKEELPKATGTTPGELPPELYTKKELAQRLKVSPRSIELDPDFPCIRWGRSVRYSWPDVIEYLKAGTIKNEGGTAA